ncbi:fasciclin domain-containing protein [Pedobacter arcticus]|uniref:fasciclin domain-containing protein n=1 Tax=Pedobacter arcticus TaxID=752140 RepID=UPI000474ED4B|nr:fasciclin domain-containing protein [Pedobacter arcticus]
MRKILLLSMICMVVFASCNNSESASDATEPNQEVVGGGQSSVQDDDSQKNVVQVAMGSPDHTTLVAAVKAAGLVDALTNAGPFTVFAPTNAAFDKLPAGTVENLLKPENKDDLADLLQYHVSLGVLKLENFTDGQTIGQVNGENITIIMKDGKPVINGNANIIATVPAANGVIYVVDNVILPPAK